MSTSLDEDLIILQKLDFDFDVTCDWVGFECESTAVWKIVLSCCGRFVFYCEEHWELQKAILSEADEVWDQDPPKGCGNPTSILSVEKFKFGT